MCEHKSARDAFDEHEWHTVKRCIHAANLQPSGLEAKDFVVVGSQFFSAFGTGFDPALPAGVFKARTRIPEVNGLLVRSQSSVIFMFLFLCLFYVYVLMFFFLGGGG